MSKKKDQNEKSRLQKKKEKLRVPLFTHHHLIRIVRIKSNAMRR